MSCAPESAPSSRGCSSATSGTGRSSVAAARHTATSRRQVHVVPARVHRAVRRRPRHPGRSSTTAAPSSSARSSDRRTRAAEQLAPAVRCRATTEPSPSADGSRPRAARSASRARPAPGEACSSCRSSTASGEHGLHGGPPPCQPADQSPGPQGRRPAVRCRAPPAPRRTPRRPPSRRRVDHELAEQRRPSPRGTAARRAGRARRARTRRRRTAACRTARARASRAAPPVDSAPVLCMARPTSMKTWSKTCAR